MCSYFTVYMYARIKPIFFISIHYFLNNVIWTWQYSALNNSKQLWLTEQDLDKIKPVSIPAWLEEEAQNYSIPTELLLALYRYYGRKIFNFFVHVLQWKIPMDIGSNN